VGSGVIVARESRAHVRVRARIEARISTLDAVEDASGARYYVVAMGTTLDVADAGLGVEAESALAAGRRVIVELDLGDGLTVERSGRVVWHTQDSTGASFMGIVFDEVLTGLASYAQRRGTSG
jgi:hypothetical protein